MRNLINNYLHSLKNKPLPFDPRLWWVFFAYISLALLIGFSSGLFQVGWLQSNTVFYLPLTLLIFPAFLEESLFRGLLIPSDTLERELLSKIKIIAISTISFVVWHPLNALTINPAALHFFLNPYFLSITLLLGITCSLFYIYTKSLWYPVAIHWLTVLVWVLWLGGRNKLLD